MLDAKKITLLYFTLCIWALAHAQPSQLPSLFGDAQDENTYLHKMQLKPGENPNEKIRSNIFIKVSVSKTNCFAGEPVLALYQLYAGLPTQPKVTRQPAFSGCSVAEMTTDEPAYIQKIEGKLYRIYLIRKVQLTPLQEGELIIPAARVSNEVSFSAPDNPYRMQSYTAEVSSQPIVIQVKALPAAKPSAYTGVAGRFTITATVDKKRVPQGENDLLKITISGQGNMDALNEPVINWPKGIEHFESTDSQHINKLDFPINGDKTFAFPFIGVKEGRTTIPAVGFTFFNTTTATFETVYTQPVTITVTHALPAAVHRQQIVTEDISNKKYLWFVPAIAVAVITIFLITNKKDKQGRLTVAPVTKSEEASEIQEQVQTKPDFTLLLEALSEVEDNRVFFTNAKALLTGALQYALGTSQHAENALTALVQHDERTNMITEEVKQLYAAFNQSLYSPVINEAQRSKLIEQLSHAINELKKV